MKDLKGKVAFVTGGSSGIGLGIVKVLAEEGMRVVFTYRQQKHLDEAMAYFRGRPGQQVHAVQLDVVDREGFVHAADQAERMFGPVQVLVNNAGVGIMGLIEQARFSDWDWIISVNIGGVVNGVMTFLPRMLASGRECHIVNVASIGGIAALGTAGLYATTKFAVVGLSEALRTDLIGRNVGVSVYCPGLVKSNIGDSERGRPAHLADTGYQAPQPPPPQAGDAPPSMMDAAMDAVEAGRHVLRGIRDNQLFILSHPEFRDVLTARCKRMLDSISNDPIDTARAESVKFILSNPIYSEGA